MNCIVAKEHDCTEVEVNRFTKWKLISQLLVLRQEKSGAGNRLHIYASLARSTGSGIFVAPGAEQGREENASIICR
jgi:hypothetical protein